MALEILIRYQIINPNCNGNNHFHVLLGLVFSSYARGENTAESDIDIVVEINRPLGLNFVAMADEIESYFGIKTDAVPVKPECLQSVKKDIVYT